MEQKSGTLFILSGPAGVGKNAISAKLFERLPDLHRTITATTRKPRQGEVEKHAYFFLTPDEFDKHIDQGDFIEWVWFAGHEYGTLREPIMKSLDDGHSQLMNIDVRGAKVFRQTFPNLVSIFIMPPTFESLRERMVARGQNTEQEINDKLAIAKEEITHQKEFDYMVVNDDLDKAVEEIAEIIKIRQSQG